jgi:uncharacterized protein YigA (DUF484 family)
VAAAEVAAFLRANPLFLAEHPELYRALEPPQRVHGAALEDHMAAMLRAERAHGRAMAERADDVLAAGRAAASLTARVQEAVLALMRAQSLIESIAAELPVLLAIDAASLCMEAECPGARRLPAGLVRSLLDGRTVLFRLGGPESGLLHGEAVRLARCEALVRIPGHGPPALLALTSRDAAALDPVQGTGALAFLGRAIAAGLGR